MKNGDECAGRREDRRLGSEQASPADVPVLQCTESLCSVLSLGVFGKERYFRLLPNICSTISPVLLFSWQGNHLSLLVKTDEEHTKNKNTRQYLCRKSPNVLPFNLLARS